MAMPRNLSHQWMVVATQRKSQFLPQAFCKLGNKRQELDWSGMEAMKYICSRLLCTSLTETYQAFLDIKTNYQSASFNNFIHFIVPLFRLSLFCGLLLRNGSAVPFHLLQ